MACHLLNGQNIWTWVHGDNTVYNAGIYGSKGTPATGNQPGSRNRSTSWTDPSGNLWMFGGFGYASVGAPQSLNDLWKYDPISNQWAWISGANIVKSTGIYGVKGTSSSTNMPGARYGGSGWTDPGGNLWLFGGYGYAETGPAQFLNDLWKYNPVTDEWTWMNGDKTTNMVGISGIKGFAAASNKPGSRYGGAVWKDLQGKLWMFGGKGYSSSLAGDLNDLWMYDPVSSEWTWVSGDNTINNAGSFNVLGSSSPSNKPGSRYLSACWTDKAGNLWMFGGEGYGSTSSKGHLNDLWMYDIALKEWSWKGGDNTINQAGIYGSKGIPATSNRPGARQGTAGWSDENGNLWLFGGYISTSLYFNDLWRYSPVKNEWTWVQGDNTSNNQGIYGSKGVAAASNMPGSRYVSATWKDNQGNFWLFGGEGYSASPLGYLNDLWKICVITGSINPATATICPGSSQTLTTSGGTSYQWSLNGSPIPGATSSTYEASLGGTYAVMISNGSCSITATNTTIITVASPIPGSVTPATASICTSGSQTLLTSGGTTYEWFLNGTKIIGATGATYTASLPGTYSVLIGNGTCTAAAGNTSVITRLPEPLGSIIPAA
ncbi:MAG: kelch repeat-containing protein, partial [Chitinophagaceae bacterium]